MMTFCLFMLLTPPKWRCALIMPFNVFRGVDVVRMACTLIQECTDNMLSTHDCEHQRNHSSYAERAQGPNFCCPRPMKGFNATHGLLYSQNHAASSYGAVTVTRPTYCPFTSDGRLIVNYQRRRCSFDTMNKNVVDFTAL